MIEEVFELLNRNSIHSEEDHLCRNVYTSYTHVYSICKVGRKRKAAMQVSNQPSKAMHRDA